MVSDEEYEAALELEIWCNDRIEEGINSTDDMSIDQQIDYSKLLMAWEKYSLSDLDLSRTDETYDSLTIKRVGNLIRLMSRNIMDKYCS